MLEGAKPLHIKEIQEFLSTTKSRNSAMRVAEAIERRDVTWTDRQGLVDILMPIREEIARIPVVVTSLQAIARSETKHLTRSKREERDLCCYTYLVCVLAYGLGRLDIDRAFELGSEAVDLARLTADRALESTTLDTLGWIQTLRGRNDEAIVLHKRAALLVRRHSGGGAARSLNNLALAYARQCRYDEAIEAAKDAVGIVEEHKDVENVLHFAVASLASVYALADRPEESLVHYRRAVVLARERGKTSSLALNLSNLGRTFIVIGDYASAIGHLRESLEVSGSEGADLATTHVSIGRVLMKLDEPDEAEPYLRKGLTMAAAGDKWGEMSARTLLADLLARQDPTGAEDLLLPALYWYRESGERGREAATLVELGRISLLKNQHEEADAFLQQGLEIASDLEKGEAVRKALLYLARLAEVRGDGGAALKRYEEGIELCDTENPDETTLDLYREQAELQRALGNVDGCISTFMIYHQLALVVQERIRKRELNHQRVLLRAEQLEAERQIEALRREQAEADLRASRMELAQAAIDLEERQVRIEKISATLRRLLGDADDESSAQIHTVLTNLLRGVDSEVRAEAGIRVNGHLQQVDPIFFDRLREVHPNLTGHQRKLCGLVRSGLSSKQIASVLHVTVDGVKKGRYRLRKELGLTREVRLEGYLAEIGIGRRSSSKEGVRAEA